MVLVFEDVEVEQVEQLVLKAVGEVYGDSHMIPLLHTPRA
jgi:hypothetical protein